MNMNKPPFEINETILTLVVEIIEKLTCVYRIYVEYDFTND